MKITECPCGSGQPLSLCCLPYIQGLDAPNAEKLMRSRYSAYALKNYSYILSTALPTEDPSIALSSLQSWAEPLTWTRLMILNTAEGHPTDHKGMVEFQAHYIDEEGVPQVHHEISSFIKQQGAWKYEKGQYPDSIEAQSTKVARNEPCPCGSGKKYKKCCA